MRRYFHRDEALQFFGVATPGVRRLERELWAAECGGWTLDEGLSLADQLVRRPELEAKLFGFTTLHRFRTAFDGTVVSAAEEWLGDGHCASWAAVDALANLVLSPALSADATLLPRVRRWGRHQSLWLRRAALVTLVPFARRGRWLDEAYQDVQARAGDPEDLMHKAMGWLLREAGKTDGARLKEFVLSHGRGLPRVTVRYAIERFPEAVRQSLLDATR